MAWHTFRTLSYLMALVNKDALAVIIARIVRPTPVIAKVWAYPLRDKDGPRLAIHIMSDCGAFDTIIQKLCDKAESFFRECYENDHAVGLEQWEWVHSDTNTALPPRAQILYVRPVVT